MSALFRSQRGRQLHLRPLTEQDEPALVAMLIGLSPATVYARYLMPLPNLSAEAARREVQRLFALLYNGSLVFVACDEASGAIVAIAELARQNNAREQAEAALLVTDAYQREGVGRAVTAELVEAAPQAGISSVTALARFDNRAVQRLARSLGKAYTAQMDGGMVRFVFS
jgi:acetyltransferase